MFSRGKPWQIWQISGSLLKFAIPILIMSPKVYSPIVSDEKFTKLFLYQTFAPYSIQELTHCIVMNITSCSYLIKQLHNVCKISTVLS